ncbi:MAG TPA: 5'-nucleotidase C-terminal domain-containing protein [Bacteroidia bacterium]|nr:5'-nucleotidase C-terminal domain-containing protein [Bacteroidia bacterium]HNT80265.1 5'-nucleotidase C-terminal domain-containing protein [Bacteroidia bacterium]
MRYLLIISFLFAVACSPSFTTVKSNSELNTLGTKEFVQSDSNIYRKYLPYKNQLDQEMNRVIAYSDSPLEKGQPESKLGNFFSDALLFYCNEKLKTDQRLPIDFAVFNNGGLRASLPKGEITVGNIFQLMPFENELVVLELDSTSIIPLIYYIIGKGGIPVSGLKLSLQNQIITEFKIGNTPYDSSATYRLLTSSYLANGGDQFWFFEKNKNRFNTGIKIREALIEYLEMQNKKGQRIEAELDQRISYEP